MLLALNVLQTFLSGVPCTASTAVPLFVGTQCVLIFYIALLMCYQPMLHDESWKLPTKVGTIAVCSVAATLNFVAMLQYSECNGAPVDAADAETAAAVISALFIGSAVVVILLMFFAFTMMLIMGGDDLLSRSIRVFVVLSCWLTRCGITSCAACCCPNLLPPSDDEDETADAGVMGGDGGGDFVDGTVVSCDATGGAAGARGRKRASTTRGALVVDEVVPVFSPDGSIDLSSIDEISDVSGSRPVSVSSLASSSSASISPRRSVPPRGGRRSVRWSDETLGSSASRHSMDVLAAHAAAVRVRSSTPPSDLHPHSRRRAPTARGGGGGGRNRRRRPVSVRLNLGFANLAAELGEAAAHKERKPKNFAPKKHNKKHIRRVSTQRVFAELETALSAKKGRVGREGSRRNSKRGSSDYSAAAADAFQPQTDRGGYATPPASMAAEWAAALQGTTLASTSGGDGGGGKQPAASGKWIPGSPPLPKPALFGDGRLDALVSLDLSSAEFSEGTPIGDVTPSRKTLKNIVKEQSAKLSKSLSLRDILSAPTTPRAVVGGGGAQVHQPASAFDAFTAEMANLDTSVETPRTPTPRTPGGRLKSRNPSFIKDGVGTPRDTDRSFTRGIGRAMEL